MKEIESCWNARFDQIKPQKSSIKAVFTFKITFLRLSVFSQCQLCVNLSQTLFSLSKIYFETWRWYKDWWNLWLHLGECSETGSLVTTLLIRESWKNSTWGICLNSLAFKVSVFACRPFLPFFCCPLLACHEGRQAKPFSAEWEKDFLTFATLQKHSTSKLNKKIN